MNTSEAARVIGLAALVQYETGRMLAENQRCERLGEAPAYCGKDWYCHAAAILQALVDQGDL